LKFAEHEVVAATNAATTHRTLRISNLQT